MAISTTRNRDDDMQSKVDLAKGQAKFTTKVPDKGKNDIEGFKEKIQTAKDMVLQTMILSSKYQILGDEKSNKSSDMLNSIATIAKFDMDEIQLLQSMKTADIQQKAAFAQTSHMQGKRVSIDDSVRKFSGNPVNFRYEIMGKNVPDGAVIQTQISVMSSDGKKVFSETNGSGKIGKNSFAWSGRDNNNEKIEPGDYSIVVSASYTIPGKEGSAAPLRTSTSKEGNVDRVEIDDDYNLSLIVDGASYDMSSIRGITAGGSDKNNESQKPISEYMGYVGKTVAIKQNKTDFYGKATNVPFISNNAIKDATIKVEFLDDAGQAVAYAESKSDIQAGQNYFLWNGWDAKSASEFQEMSNKKLDVAYISPGIYTYTVTVVSKDKTGAEVATKLDNHGSYLIESVDKSSGKVVIESREGYKFNINNVTKISDAEPTKTSYNQMLEEGANLLGKYASFVNDTINYDGKTNPEILYSVPNIAGSTPGTARINIIDTTGTIINTITQNVPYTEASVTVPTPANVTDVVAQLSEESAMKVQKYWDETFPGQDPSSPTEEQITKMQKYIAIGFRNGSIAQIGFDGLPDDKIQRRQYVLRNIGQIPVTWDGQTASGTTAKAGKYTYNIEYDTTDNTTNARTTTKVPRDSCSAILSTRIDDDGEIVLELENGVEIPTSKATRLGIMPL